MEMLRAFHDLVTDETSRSAARRWAIFDDARRAEISAAGQVRDAGLAGGRAGVAAKRRRSDRFDRNRFCRAAIPWFARLGGAYWKERCLTRRWVRSQKLETIANLYLRLRYFFKSPAISANGANGTSYFERKAAREAMSECGQRANFN